MQLFFIKDVQTGLVWVTKIVTDPFHDIKLYHKAPLYLLRGELIDPTTAHGEDEATVRGATSTLVRAASLQACLGRGRARTVREHLSQDAAPDRLVRCAGIGPPPAVALHRLGGGDEAVGHRVEIRLGVVRG